MNRRAFYDSPDFQEDWYSDTPLRVLSERYGVAISTLREAAMRRNFTPRLFTRPRTCKTPGCNRVKFCRGYCSLHYQRAKKEGFRDA